MKVGYGSSPRLRGTGGRPKDFHWNHRFIPAPAGNSLDNAVNLGVPTVHPRACGEQTNHYVIDLV